MHLCRCSLYKTKNFSCWHTYSVLECVFLSKWPEAVVPLWGSLGEDGSDESVISSMSEWEEADLGDFFLLNACLKELLSCRQKAENGGRDNEQMRNTHWKILGGRKKGKVKVKSCEKVQIRGKMKLQVGCLMIWAAAQGVSSNTFEAGKFTTKLFQFINII